MHELVVVGGGRMGEALLAGLLEAGRAAGELAVAEVSASRRARSWSRYAHAFTRGSYRSIRCKQTSSNSTGLLKRCPFSCCNACSVTAYISALPPLSEWPAKTCASLHNTPCVHRPMPRLPDSLSSIATLCQISDW